MSQMPELGSNFEEVVEIDKEVRPEPEVVLIEPDRNYKERIGLFKFLPGFPKRINSLRSRDRSN